MIATDYLEKKFRKRSTVRILLLLWIIILKRNMRARFILQLEQIVSQENRFSFV